MALFRMDPGYGFAPELLIGTLYFYPIAAGGATANQQITPSKITVTAGAQGQYLGPNNNIAPSRAKLKIFVDATSASFAYIATNANSVNIYTISLLSFPANIVYADANLIQAPASTATLTTTIARTANVLSVDNTNKLIYVGINALSGGALTNSVAGDQVCVSFAVQDQGIAT